MGQKISKANEYAAKNASDEKSNIATLMTVLENKRREFLAEVSLARGDGVSDKTEVQGGRTVNRISEIRISSNNGADPRLKDAIADFFTAAQGGDNPKAVAVEGAKALLETGLDSLFGATAGQGMEKRGFVVLFMNYAFVRIDFYVYTYTASGSAWGAVANESGSCYVADIAVLDPFANLRSCEIDYLLGQSLAAPTPAPDQIVDADSEFNTICKLKIQLAESAILSRLLRQPDITLTKLQDYTTGLVETQKVITSLFATLSDYEYDLIDDGSVNDNDNEDDDNSESN